MRQVTLPARLTIRQEERDVQPGNVTHHEDLGAIAGEHGVWLRAINRQPCSTKFARHPAIDLLEAVPEELAQADNLQTRRKL